jgi:hypothetical protein
MLQSHFEISERSHPVPGLCSREYAGHAGPALFFGSASIARRLGIGKLPTAGPASQPDDQLVAGAPVTAAPAIGYSAFTAT